MISLENAKKALTAAETKAGSLSVAVAVVITDEHGVVIASSRMDGALVISHEFAIAKAYTSAALRMPTDAIAPFAVEGKPYHGFNTLFGGKMTSIAGGIPVMVDGKVVGAVGVGGSADTQQDVQCAQEAVKVLSM